MRFEARKSRRMKLKKEEEIASFKLSFPPSRSHDLFSSSLSLLVSLF